MTQVLGRVVSAELECPRGPDASHRIRVPRAWVEHGATIEFELPRHLSCRACDGGGCDACERSGAVTLRARGEPPDVVEVKLPARADDEWFVIRIPEHGGLPTLHSGLPRGHLFLRIEPGSAPDASASVARQLPSVVGPRETRARMPAPARWVPPRLLFVAAAAAGLLLAIWLLSR